MFFFNPRVARDENVLRKTTIQISFLWKRVVGGIGMDYSGQADA